MRSTWIIFLSLVLGGCAGTPVYNPMQQPSQQEISLNENSFKAIQDGMSMDQVHNTMGQELIIGYEYQEPNYKPLTIPNPYKTDTIKGTDYVIEYYIQDIRQPDGIISDNELMPLIFKNGRLVGRGWPLANTILPAKSSP